MHKFQEFIPFEISNNGGGELHAKMHLVRNQSDLEDVKCLMHKINLKLEGKEFGGVNKALRKEIRRIKWKKRLLSCQR